MKCRENIKKQAQKILVALILLIMCKTSLSYATVEPTPEPTASPGGGTATNTPLIEMRVKEQNENVMVECWVKNFINLEGIETVFTYDSTILQPSNVSTNEILTNLDSIKYDRRQDSDIDYGEFDINSRGILGQAFSFEEEFQEPMYIDVFRYLAPDEDQEALQFVAINTSDEITISSEDYEQDEKGFVKIGKFSFKKIDMTKEIKEGVFSTRRARIVCTDGLTPGEEESDYWKELANGDVCEEMLTYVYKQFGSLSGIIDASITTTGGTKLSSKNITNIKIYEKSSFPANFNFSNANYRNNLPDEPYKEYKTTAEENGVFTIEEIEYGEYIVLFDKDNYSDFIITNLVIESSSTDLTPLLESKGVAEGKIALLPGDINKDGKIDTADTRLYNKDTSIDQTYAMDFDDAQGTRNRKKVWNTTLDTRIYNAAVSQYSSSGRKTITVKKIINL